MFITNSFAIFLLLFNYGLWSKVIIITIAKLFLFNTYTNFYKHYQFCTTILLPGWKQSSIRFQNEVTFCYFNALKIKHFQLQDITEENKTYSVSDYVVEEFYEEVIINTCKIFNQIEVFNNTIQAFFKITATEDNYLDLFFHENIPRKKS